MQITPRTTSRRADLRRIGLAAGATGLGAGAGIAGTPFGADRAVADGTATGPAVRPQPRTAVLSFPGSLLRVGSNKITLSRGTGTPAGNGLGWDTLLLEGAESVQPAPAQLAASIVGSTDRGDQRVWQIKITNTGRGAAQDVRLSCLGGQRGATPVVFGRDPNRFPVPITARLAAGASVLATARTDRSSDRIHPTITADGGLTRAAS